MSKSIKRAKSKPARLQPCTKRNTSSVVNQRAQLKSTARNAGAAAPANGKIASIIALLRRPKGATIAELCKATDWQAHSIRGALSGAIKKKLGLKVTSDKADGVRTYRIAT